MKKTIIFAIGLVLGTLAFGYVAHAQSIPSQSPFWVSGSNITPIPLNAALGLKIPSLASQNCLGTDSTGVFEAGTCSGGGGSSTFSTTSLSAVAPLQYSQSPLAQFSITQSGISGNGYLSSTDFNTFNNKISSTSLSVTTLGTSGAATYTPSTGVFNIPQYQAAGTYVTGVSGTANEITSSGSTAITLSLPNHVIFPIDYVASAGSTTNATSTNFAITGGASNCNGTSALTTNSSGVVGCTAQPQGTVTSVSVATANGFGGTSSGGATPSLTLTTSVTGLLKGNGTAISAATPGTDYDVFAWPFTPTSYGNATSSTIGFTGGILSIGSSTIVGNATTTGMHAFGSVRIPSLGVAAGTFLAVDPNGVVIATTTPQGTSGAFSPAANYATVAGLPAYTYVAGVITEVSNGALSVDGNNPTVGQIILVKNESGACMAGSGACNNGLYNVTAAGSGIAAFVLTRNSNYNSSSNVIPGIVTYIISGATLADDFWALTSAAPITVGTTALNYTEVSGGGAAVTSVSNSDSTLTISPTAGAVVASLNLGHSNSWSVLQNFTNATSTLFSSTYASSTNYFGANLASCNSASSALTWNSGFFGCNTISAGAAYPFTPATFGINVSATSTPLYPAGLITGTSTIGALVASSSITNQSVKNALVLNGATGLEGAYSGCSGTIFQFVQNISSTGGCSSGQVSAGYFANVAANTVFGNFTGASAQPTFTATSSLFTFGNGIANTANVISLASIAQGWLGNVGSASAVPISNATSTLFTGSTGQFGEFTGSGALKGTSDIFDSSTFIGISSTTPFNLFSVGTLGTTYGSIAVTENKVATSTSITIDWTKGNQQLVQLGFAGTTITFSNFTVGAHLLLNVCNPNGTAGAVTWGTQIIWAGAGAAPTQTTTSGACDLWSFDATQATSTSPTARIFGAATLNF